MTPLQKAAQAVIDRWNSPSWKDQPHTAEYIEELRKALDAELQQAVEPVAWRWDILPDSPLMKRKGQKSGVYLENPKDIGIDVNGVKSLENYKWTPLYLHPPQPQAKTPLNGFDMRGVLASNLLCWMRLTEAEAQDLVYFFEKFRTAKGEKP